MDGNDWSLTIMRATPPATLQIIGPGNFQRWSKIIATGRILPKWALRWYCGIIISYRIDSHDFQLVR
jgi:hypothetical protein